MTIQIGKTSSRHDTRKADSFDFHTQEFIQKKKVDQKKKNTNLDVFYKASVSL